MNSPRTTALSAFLAFAFFSPTAGAHDFWINYGGYRSPDGVHCCGPGDCAVVPDDNVRISPIGYVLQTGETVPFAEAQPSEDGHYWRCKRFDGTRRCFFAPQPGS